jgi:hypothetical protein
MGNNINTAKNFVKKPTIRKSSNSGEDIMTYFENIKRTVEFESTNNPPTSYKKKILRKFIPARFSKFNLMSDNKLKKVDSYVKSPQYLQRYKLFLIKTQNIFEKFYKNSSKENTTEKFSSFMKLQNPLSVAKDLTKKKFRKFLFYFVLIMLCYSLLKYIRYKFSFRAENRDLSEVLKLVNDLRKQNEELSKQNKELVDKILKER